MSDRSPNYDDRLARLEADLQRMRELADRAVEREPIGGSARQPRPAKTYRQSGLSYPSDPCTVYPIIFLDSTFTETEGNQSRTDTDRQASYGVELAFYDGGYLAEDTIVDVYRDNGRWWITRGGGSGEIYWAVIQSGTNGEAQSGVRYFKAISSWHDSSNTTGLEYDVVTPVRTGQHTALFAGDVVGYVLHPESGDPPPKVIITGCWDDAMLTVKAWDSNTTPPNGWTDFTASKGCYLRGRDLANDAGWGVVAVGDNDFGSLTHDNCDHAASVFKYTIGTAELYAWATVPEGETSHMDPWLGIQFIKRTE